MTEESPDDECQVIEQVEQDQEPCGDAVVAGQCDEGDGDDGKLGTVLGDFVHDMQVAGLAKVQYHPVIVRAKDVAEGVESQHFAIAATEDGPNTQSGPIIVQAGKKEIHDE